VLVDLDDAHRAREKGVRGLGQMHKSFRDRSVNFQVYDRQAFDSTYLDSLGALEKPQRTRP
jgi:hypothetical protein